MSAERLSARQTLYNGVWMRSRNEARFAGLMDELGVQWAYEGPCYASRKVQYLPDFTILGLEIPLFVEVKAAPPMMEGVLDRMQVVRSSVSDALLAITCPAWAGAMLLDVGGIVCTAHWGRRNGGPVQPFVLGAVDASWSVLPRTARRWGGRAYELDETLEFPECEWSWEEAA